MPRTLSLLRDRRWVALAPIVAAVVLAASSSARAAEPAVEFNRDVRPILSDNCFACHGFDPKTRKAKLRLDTAEGAFADRDGNRAVVPGELDKSLVWSRIVSKDPDEQMPPPDSHKKLTDAQRAVLKRWIEQGAKYQQHWSFEPVRRPEVPAVDGAQNPIDAFLAERLKKEGLKPATEADRPTLIRRAAFALTGLPPTPAEVDAFVRDSAPGAYERVVDRYLASPRFGEEMARHWLDLARYADTHGLHLDNERQTWAYRDWVVKAYNENKPFDRFTVEQIAGDLLPQPKQEQLTATGFLRCNVSTSEGGSIESEFVYRYAVDRTQTVASTWMGLTAGCAVCHDHKFDPISAKEFYSLYAFFNSAADPGMDGNALLTRPTIKLTTPEQERRLAAVEAKLAAKQKELDAKTESVAYTDPATLEPKPPVQELSTVWLDDDFPTNAKPMGSPGHPTKWVTAAEGAPVHAGKRALKRTDGGLAQDYYENGAEPLVVPPAGVVFAHVYLDPANPPKTIMVQFHKGEWKHRAVWGDYDAIAWGKPGSTEKANFGKLPAAGAWVRLEIPIAKVGLQPGDKLTGFALTQFGGTVYWDSVGVTGRADPAADPTRSLLAWWKPKVGKNTPDVPADVAKLLKDGPDKVKKPEDLKRLRTYYLQNVYADSRPLLGGLADEVAALRKEKEAIEKDAPGTFVFMDLPKPRDSFVMVRGQYNKPGDKVEPGTPAFLPPLKKADPAGRATRLDLANWLVSPEHPLTARVAVNQYWQQFFGTGLVKTSGDFGSQGEPPSHPELLDWLAARFVNGWDVKALVRLMVTSEAFRRDSAAAHGLLARDPENRLLARGPRFRLDAEQIRDNALFVAGLLNEQMGGPGVRTYQPPNIWEPVGFVGSNTREYRQDRGDKLYRRSLYVFLKRTAHAPFLANFDAPNREQSCSRRERSNTPLQALQLMNDVQFFEASRALAERMVTEGGAAPAGRIAFAYRTVLSRAPDAEEVAVVREQLEKHLARY
ncbi:MAG TPA: PSD1 and planctomycete cytochrome C domain-containing protein, partial [Humisphaera sp.]